MTCNLPVDAPLNDLQFYQTILMYESVNKIISSTAIKALKKHWYLTKEMVPLALWSDKVPKSEKRSLADAIIAIKPNTATV